jgi:hypothetical protein
MSVVESLAAFGDRRYRAGQQLPSFAAGVRRVSQHCLRENGRAWLSNDPTNSPRDYLSRET